MSRARFAGSTCSAENCSQTKRPTVRDPGRAQRLDPLEAVVLIEEGEVELVLRAPSDDLVRRDP